MPPKKPRVLKQCPICDNKFAVIKTQLHKRKYCSRSCAAKARTDSKNSNWRGGKIVRECETCGRQFTAKQKDVRAGYARFCSRKCWGQSRSLEFRGENGCNWQGGPVDKACLNCGRQYEINKSRLDTSSFCSRECQRQYYLGENHYAWQGGPKPYPPIWTRRFKRTIRRRDDYACAICGVAPSKIVHHIDYDKQNCDQLNLVTLCKPCHSRTNGQRDLWEGALFEYQQCRKEAGYV